MARWRSYARVYTAPECGFRHPDKKADSGVSTIEPRVAKHTWMLQCTLARNAVGWPQLSVLLGTNTSVNSRAAPCLCDACDCIVWLHRCSMRARKQPWINRQTAAAAFVVPRKVAAYREIFTKFRPLFSRYESDKDNEGGGLSSALFTRWTRARGWGKEREREKESLLWRTMQFDTCANEWIL